ncbi:MULTISPECIES: HAD family hydrolase [unclassified Paenibacillus]|uniref:HAD family hydrolase n=1 Tax=unclassified Paenibacillus TaxID=185978 RepID=UPI002F3EDDC5
MYQNIVFDVDGTLLDSDQAILISLHKVLLEELGREFSAEELTPVLGMPTKKSLKLLKVPDVDRADARLLQYLKEHNDLMTLYSGITDMLEKLVEDNIHIGIVTSKTREEFQVDFIPLGIHHYFSHIICADDTAKHKPEPDPLLKYVEQTGINPATTLYVGDTVYDQKCANGAGIDFALALWGAKQPESTEAQHRLSMPEDILKI